MENSRIDTYLIQQYLEGKLDPGLMHQLEREALDDPFLADAIEGYSYAKKPMDHQLSILQRQLEQRIAVQQENKNRFNYSWQRLSVAAAAGLIFITAGILFWMRFQPAKELSKNSAKKPVPGVFSSPPTISGADTTDNISEEIYAVAAIAKISKKSPGHPLSARNSSDAAVNSEPLTTESSGKEQSRPAAFEDFIAARPVQQNASDAFSKSEVTSIISGKVVSAKTDEPLPGSTVFLNGKRAFVSTNLNGEFKIPAGVNDTLNISTLGFETVKIKAEPGKVNEVRLNENTKALSEVVVIGNGAQKRESATGAVSTVSEIAYPELASTGSEDFYKLYLKNNLKRPERSVSGNVRIGFSVNPNGTLGDFKVLKGLNDVCDAEAIRLIKEGPAWKPGKKIRNVKITVDFSSGKERY